MTAMKLPSATFTSALKGMRLPSRRKLVAEYVLGGSEGESIKNRANPAKPLTVQGTPTYNANSVVVRSSATAGFGFTTGVIPNDDATLIVVRKGATVASQPQIVGTVNAGGYYGVQEYSTSNWGRNGENSLIKGPSRAKPAAGTIYFEALTLTRQNRQYSTGGLASLYYYSGGTQQVAVSADFPARGRREIQQVCIGTTNLTDSVTTNNLEIYFVAIYQRNLSAAEIDAAYQAIVAYYATLGVTVV